MASLVSLVFEKIMSGSGYRSIGDRRRTGYRPRRITTFVYLAEVAGCSVPAAGSAIRAAGHPMSLYEIDRSGSRSNSYMPRGHDTSFAARCDHVT
jgi:hypothetical protein